MRREWVLMVFAAAVVLLAVGLLVDPVTAAICVLTLLIGYRIAQ